MMKEPVVTLSPTAALISFTTPANGAGTSIEALSPSTDINVSSSATVSPTLTEISVTSTSSSPISGMLTSNTCAAAAATGAASTAGASASVTGAAAPASAAKIKINEPVLTLSPTFTRISCTTPACGAGTSIDALSPSTASKVSSSATVSPI